MIKELFQPDLLLIMKNGNYKDYSDYFSALYDRQESFDKPFVDSQYYGLYSPDRHSGSMKTRSFPMDGSTWVEFQAWLDSAYTLATPVNLWSNAFISGQLSAPDALAFAAAAGIYIRPVTVPFGHVPITTLTASDGTVLGTGLVTSLQWEIAYNTLLIPYERSINSNVSNSLKYIKNLQQFGDNFLSYRTSTLKFDGTGNYAVFGRRY